MSAADYKKITQALNYVAQKEGGEINYMKAIKLLYLSDRLHLRKYGRLISDDSLLAMKNGTLGSRARDIATKNNGMPHDAYTYSADRLETDLDKHTITLKDKSFNSLSETDVECLDEIYDAFGAKEPFDLAELTHELPEWKRYQFEIETKKAKVKRIQLSDLFDDVDNVELRKVFAQSVDELNLARALFDENKEQDALLR